MDWKYKHFCQQRVFPAPRDVVLEAARAVMAESLGWQLTDATQGFTASGSSFAHGAVANFRIQSTAGGTKVDVELLVERAGFHGFMLVDVGGYYNIQIRKWLDAIQWAVRQKLTGHEAPAHPPVQPPNKAAACLFNGCLMFIVVTFGLWFLVTFICAAFGLVTGHLYLLGRSGTLAVHGMWGRVISALILLFGAWIVWRIKMERSPPAFFSGSVI